MTPMQIMKQWRTEFVQRPPEWEEAAPWSKV